MMMSNSTQKGKKLSQSQRIREMLSNINALAPMPKDVIQVIRELDNPEINIGELENMLRSNVALTVGVLRQANSVALGFRTKTKTIQEALVRLGLKRIRALVVSYTVSSIVDKELKGYGLKTGELWAHSLATAYLSQKLAKKLKYSEPELVYVAGLLHDIGKVVLDPYLFEFRDHIKNSLETNQFKLWQAEEEIMGIAHATLGGLMAEKWNFPQIYVDAIRFHHTPTSSSSIQLVCAIIDIADSFAPRSKGSLVNLGGSLVNPESLSILDIDDAFLKEFYDGEIENLQNLMKGQKVEFI